jgi:hypothetical protein
VLYYQVVDLDPASLGIKVPVGPTIPDITIAASPAYATTTNGMPSLELPDPVLPSGLGEARSTSPVAEPTPHHPMLTAPSSPSLATNGACNFRNASVFREKFSPVNSHSGSRFLGYPNRTSGRAYGGLFKYISQFTEWLKRPGPRRQMEPSLREVQPRTHHPLSHLFLGTVSLMRRRLCRALACYGVVVTHALAIMSSGSVKLKRP